MRRRSEPAAQAAQKPDRAAQVRRGVRARVVGIMAVDYFISKLLKRHQNGE